MWREEIDHVIIEEGQPRGTEAKCVGTQIKLAAEGACLDLCRAIPAIPIVLEDGAQIRQQEDIQRGITRQFLLQAEIGSLVAELACLEQFQRTAVTMKEVCSG